MTMPDRVRKFAAFIERPPMELEGRFLDCPGSSPARIFTQEEIAAMKLSAPPEEQVKPNPSASIRPDWDVPMRRCR